MKVYILVDMLFDTPENYGIRVFATREKAEEAYGAAIADNGGESDEYLCEIEEREVEL